MKDFGVASATLDVTQSDDDYYDDDGWEPDEDYLENEREGEHERIYFNARAEVENQAPAPAPALVLDWAAELLAEGGCDDEGEPDVDEDGNVSNGSLHMVFRRDPKWALAEALRRFRAIASAFVRRVGRSRVVARPRERRSRRVRVASRGSPSGDASPLPRSAAAERRAA